MSSVPVAEPGAVAWGCVRGRSAVDSSRCEVSGLISPSLPNHCVVVTTVESFWAVGGSNEDERDFLSAGELCRAQRMLGCVGTVFYRVWS